VADDDVRDAIRGALRAPPGSWAPVRKLARKALAPVEHFLSVEAASGVVLLAAAVIALAWANSPWRTLSAALCEIRERSVQWSAGCASSSGSPSSPA